MNRRYKYYDNISFKTSFLNFFRNFLRIPFFEKELINRIASKWSRVWSKLVPPEYLYSKETIRQVNRNSIHYALDISDTVDHFIYFNFPDKAFDRIKSYVKKDFVIIDVGANIGRFTLPFAATAGDGKIISYEPDPDTFARLKLNVRKNQFNNVMLINKALGDTQDKLSLYKVNPHNAGMNRLNPGNEKGKFDSVSIQVSTLDQEVRELNLARLDIVKIDVEGFEFKTLKGAEETVLRFRPIFFVEIVDENLRDNGDTPEEVVSWFKMRGYQLFRASNMVPVDQPMLSNCHFDAICFPS